MKKNIRTGMLAILLALPVLVLLFLYTFGKNEFRIPIIYATDSTLINGRYVVTKADTIPPFRLLTNEGKFLSNKDLSNSVYVVDFFFTTCPGMCRTLSASMTRVQAEFEGDSTVKLVSFTVDPTTDSPEVLDKYAKAHRAIPGKWFFVTGSKDSIYYLAKNGFRVTALENNDAPAGSEQRFDHARHLVLVDKAGLVRGYYDGLDKEQVDRLITETAILLKEYDK
jgi:protein SCO1/2